MRIVFDIENKCESAVGGTPYAQPIGKTEYPGYFKADVSVFDCEEDELLFELEGRSDRIKELLQQALDFLNVTEQSIKESLDKISE
jgi:hypothetical protein